MRLMLLALVFCLGICLSYATYTKPVVPRATDYNGPATFVSLINNGDDDADNANWILVCRVNGNRLAFRAQDPAIRYAARDLCPNQSVRLSYVLPAYTDQNGSELGPPTIRRISPDEDPALSPGTEPVVAVSAAARSIPFPD